MGTMKFFMVALVCAGSFQASFAANKATKCIQCDDTDGSDCADSPAKIAVTCSIDDTNTQCVAYKFFKVEKGVPVEYIHRGCGPATECDTQNALSYTKLCYGCSDKDLCNDNFGTETENTICINCSGDDCNDDIVTLKDNTQFCKLDGETTKACIAYKEQSGNDVKYTRSCAAEDQCTILTKDNLLMCNKCTTDNCNLNVDTDTAPTKCIECEGKEGTDCAADNVDTAKVSSTCSLDQTVLKTCLAYKYYKVEDGKPVEYRVRGCGTTEAYDTQKALPYTKIIAQCSDKDQCNSNFGEEKESTICIACSGDDCKDDALALKDNKLFCKLDGTTNTTCIAYKYKDDKNTITARACAEQDKCSTLSTQTYKDKLVMCNKCSGDNCNLNVDTDTAPTKCIECEGKEGTDCAADNVDTAKVTSTCSLDQTVLKTCLAYKYYKVEDGKPVEYTFRGCGTTDAYDTQKALPYTKIIAQCSDKDQCNSNFGEEKESTICISCSGDDCKDDIVTLKDNTQFCKLDSETTKACIAYKEQSGTDVTYTRSCDAENKCSTLTKDNLLMCNKCTKDNCNINVDTDTAHNKCIKCEDKDETKCGADTTTVADTCTLDDTVNTECVVYKYLDTNKATITGRGCAPANNCATLNTGTYKDTLSMCNECTDDLCNVNTDTNSAHNKCIKCEDKTGSDCANNDIDTSKVTTTCSLDDTINLECVAYRYIKGENIMTYRGCAPENDCTSKNNKQNTKLCSECDTDNNCNAKIDASSEKKLCIKCDGDDCNKDDVVPTDDSQYCNILANNTCIAYKYLKKDANSTTYYRGCEEKDKGCEYLNKKENFKLGTMQGCYECDGDDLCNRNINGPATEKPETTTAGAPSIVSFNIYLLPLVVATFIAYIV